MTGGRSALWVDENIADTIAMRACRFIADHRDRPFFLYMGTQDVHVPRVPHPCSQAGARWAPAAT